MDKNYYVRIIKWTSVCLLCTISLKYPFFAHGSDFIKNTQIHGFLSQGYLKSSKMNYLYDSKNGTSDIREIGIAVHSRLSDRLRFGCQFLSRDYGQVGNNTVYIDWGFLDYQLNELSGIRAGKVKVPLGLYNEIRDTDFLRPMIFLPQGLYNEQIRDQLVAYTGIGLYGNIQLGNGNIKYDVYGGSSKWDSDSRVIEYLENQWNNSYNSLLKPVLGAMGYTENLTVEKMQGENKNVYGGRLDFYLPESGIRISYSHMVHNDQLNDKTGTKIGNFKTSSWQILSLEWIFNRISLATEYSKRNVYIDVFQNVNEEIGAEVIPSLVDEPAQKMFYILFNYEISDKFYASFLYDETDSGTDEENVPGGSTMKDRCIGLRYDISSRWTLKMEHHNMSGFNLFFNIYLFNRSGHNPEIHKDWSFWTAKISYSF